MKPISKNKNKGLAKLAKKKPELAKKFGINPKFETRNSRQSRMLKIKMTKTSQPGRTKSR